MTSFRAGEPNGDEGHPAGEERRTSLAGERTVLAWWRTSLTAIAVGFGVGRLLPELAPTETNWPYAVLGVAFTLYGIALFIVGTRRLGILNRRLEGVPGAGQRDWALATLMFMGVLLGIGTMIAIVAY